MMRERWKRSVPALRIEEGKKKKKRREAITLCFTFTSAALPSSLPAELMTGSLGKKEGRENEERFPSSYSITEAFCKRSKESPGRTRSCWGKKKGGKRGIRAANGSYLLHNYLIY